MYYSPKELLAGNFIQNIIIVIFRAGNPKEFSFINSYKAWISLGIVGKRADLIPLKGQGHKIRFG